MYELYIQQCELAIYVGQMNIANQRWINKVHKRLQLAYKKFKNLMGGKLDPAALSRYVNMELCVEMWYSDGIDSEPTEFLACTVLISRYITF